MISPISRKSIYVIAALSFFLFIVGMSVFSLSVNARNANQTEIYVDQKTNAVQIIVGGKVVALIDENGLQVDGVVTSNTGPLGHSNKNQAGEIKDAP